MTKRKKRTRAKHRKSPRVSTKTLMFYLLRRGVTPSRYRKFVNANPAFCRTRKLRRIART